MKKVILEIEGMTCSACSNSLEKYLNKQKGIKTASVNLVLKTALIEYDDKELNISNLEEFIKKSGFKSLGIYTNKNPKEEQKKYKKTTIIFGILALITMYISMGHMINLPVPSIIDINHNPIFYTIVLFLLAILFLIYGLDIIKSGIKNLIHKSPNMDTLVTISVLSSMIYSIYNMIMVIQGNSNYTHFLYFESVVMVIFFIKLGRYLDKISKDKTKEAIEKLVQITPNKAIIKVDGKEKEVTIDEVKRKDIVVSYAGDRISVDGKIIKGKAHLDESFLTGESTPISKSINDKVIAGSINYDGYLEYEAEKIGKDSTISQIVKLVVEATSTKAPIAKIADKVSSYFVPSVIIIAILTFITYIILGYSFNDAIITFVTILVVACPCALGLATPLAIVVSEGLCASQGILVKKSEVLENAKNINTIVFDKTGTLTYGNLKISEIINISKLKDEEIIQLASSLEVKTSHPIGGAFKNYVKENSISVLEVKDYQEIAGKGIIGKIKNNEIILGNAKILDQFNIKNKYKLKEKELLNKGNTIIYIVKNKQIIALIGVKDIIRKNTRQIIDKLKKKNIELIILTGDNQEVAHLIGQEIGIDNIIAGATPIDKSKIIKDLKEQGKKVLMCGDGINDSPALANANISVSITSGTDIAMDSSDVILVKNDLSKIIDLITISTHTVNIIKQNLFWAFFYNSLMIPISMGLLKPWISINPMIAGIAMVISSITVILNSLRLKKIKL